MDRGTVITWDAVTLVIAHDIHAFVLSHDRLVPVSVAIPVAAAAFFFDQWSNADLDVVVGDEGFTGHLELDFKIALGAALSLIHI